MDQTEETDAVNRDELIMQQQRQIEKEVSCDVIIVSSHGHWDISIASC